MKLLFKDKKIVAIDKPVGLSSSSDLSGGKDAMSELSSLLSKEGEDSTLFLVHRLDNVTGGVLVYARNKDAAGKLSAIFSEENAQKEYLAVVMGKAEGGTLTDYLSKDSRLGKATVTNKGQKDAKLAKLSYAPLESVESDLGTLTLVKVNLNTGRFHQIRAQMSSHGNSLLGDGKYGGSVARVKTPTLFANRLSFTLDGRRYDIKVAPDTAAFPWNLFDTKHFI